MRDYRRRHEVSIQKKRLQKLKLVKQLDQLSQHDSVNIHILASVHLQLFNLNYSRLVLFFFLTRCCFLHHLFNALILVTSVYALKQKYFPYPQYGFNNSCKHSILKRVQKPYQLFDSKQQIKSLHFNFLCLCLKRLFIIMHYYYYHH